MVEVLTKQLLTFSAWKNLKGRSPWWSGKREPSIEEVITKWLLTFSAWKNLKGRKMHRNGNHISVTYFRNSKVPYL